MERERESEGVREGKRERERGIEREGEKGNTKIKVSDSEGGVR
jgi:hypothetical protein